MSYCSSTTHGCPNGRFRRAGVRVSRLPSSGFDYGLGSGFAPPVRTPLHSYRSPYLPMLFNHTPVIAPVVDPLWVTPTVGAEQVWPAPTFMRGCSEVQRCATQYSYPNTPLWEPGTYPPEPFGVPVPLRIHPHIIPNPNNPTVPQLQWDIIHRPELATRLTGRGCIVPVDLDQAAVEPIVQNVWVTSDHPILTIWMQRWGPILVDKPDITIRDILDAIYNYFQQPMRPEDVEFATATATNGHNLTVAAHQRIQNSYELHTVGVFKRVDVVGGHRRFQGLRPVVCQDNTWKLYMGLLPGPVPRVR